MDNIDSRAVIACEKPQDDVSERMKLLVFKAQKDFCQYIQRLEGDQEFNVKKWNVEGGGGITQYLEEGEVFEKVGVCASVVQGILPVSAAVLLKKRNDWPDVPQKSKFYTAGVSGVAYPKNPNIPTLNFNYQYFELNCNGDRNIWWFRGGTDLIPYILHIEDCARFHEILKKWCDLYNIYYYSSFKKECDDHFYLEHRGERRGIGGIFFDELNYPDKKTCFDFVKTCMDNIIASYMPIVLKNKHLAFSQSDRNWQLLQRGRSIEYSLICDKAGRYALRTPGVQSENLLISLPPSVKWQYNYTPEESTEQYQLLEILRNPRDWV